MREKLDSLLAKVKDIDSKLSKRNRILVIVCVVAILAIAVIGALLLNLNSSMPLFSELNQAEAAEIMKKLEDMGVNATYNNAGTIYVPGNQVDALRAQMVLQGHPKQGLTYDTFIGNVGSMSTDFDRETYKLYDLQDRIAATIRYFKDVEDVVVFISLGNEGRYVLQKDRYAPTASVMLYMKDDTVPDQEQVKGIQRLVAFAIPGMEMDNVAVVDGFSNDLTDRLETADSNTTKLKMAIEREIERRIQQKVTYLLNPVFGPDSVRVSVTCQVDVAKKLKESIEYSSATDDDRPRGVLEKESVAIEAVGNGDFVGGVPGTELNAQIPIYPNITTDGKEIYYVDERDFQYLVSKMTEQIQYDGGDILNLTVGVVIDAERLTRTERDEFKQLVAITAGISPDEVDQKVSVVNTVFHRDAEAAPHGFSEFIKYVNDNPTLKWILIAAAALLLVILVIVILLLRRAAKKKRAKQEEEEAMLAAAAAAAAVAAATGTDDQDGLDAEDILNTPLDSAKKTREQELKMQIGEFADLNPEIAAQLIKTWLKGGSGDE